MNSEIIGALEMIEKEKNIPKEVMIEAIEGAIITACRNQHLKREKENVEVIAKLDPVTGELHCWHAMEVVETEEDVMDDVIEISLEEALKISADAEVGKIVFMEIDSKDFTRIASQTAKQIIMQKIREEERNSVFNLYADKERTIVTGIVQRNNGKQVIINLGKADAILNDVEMVKGETYKIGDRIKVFILSVANSNKGARILVSRTHPELVKRLFEQEVTEIRDGVVEIMSIAREAGSRTKMAVISHDPDVDAVGACVGQNGSRVNAVVAELKNEKVDIVEWDENPGMFIQNALSPAKIVNVFADPDEKSANVVVPDYQLSLAIGKEGQNARLAARLTGYKIDIKSETQAKDAYGFRIEDYMDDDDEYEDDYEEADYEEEYIEGAEGDEE